MIFQITHPFSSLVFCLLNLLIGHCVNALLSDKEFCESLRNGGTTVATIGLVRDRFVCVLYMKDSGAQPIPYQMYLNPSSSVDSVTKRVYLYDGKPLNQSWSGLVSLFSCPFDPAQVITVQDSSSDYVYIQGRHNASLFALDTGQTWNIPIQNKDNQLLYWISSVEELSFYGIKKMKDGNLTISKFTFDYPKMMPKVNGIKAVSPDYSICNSAENSSDDSPIEIKVGKCKYSAQNWNIENGFSDKNYFYLIISDMSRLADQRREVVVFNRSAVESGLGNSFEVDRVSIGDFFVCKRAPSGSSAGKVLIIIFAVIVVLAVILISICMCKRSKAANPIQPKYQFIPFSQKIQTLNQMTSDNKASLNQGACTQQWVNPAKMKMPNYQIVTPTQVIPQKVVNNSKTDRSSKASKERNRNFRSKKRHSKGSSSRGKSVKKDKNKKKEFSRRKPVSKNANRPSGSFRKNKKKNSKPNDASYADRSVISM